MGDWRSQVLSTLVVTGVAQAISMVCWNVLDLPQEVMVWRTFEVRVWVDPLSQAPKHPTRNKDRERGRQGLYGVSTGYPTKQSWPWRCAFWRDSMRVVPRKADPQVLGVNFATNSLVDSFWGFVMSLSLWWHPKPQTERKTGETPQTPIVHSAAASSLFVSAQLWVCVLLKKKS